MDVSCAVGAGRRGEAFAAYRLVLTLDGRRQIARGPVFRTSKSAIARVSDVLHDDRYAALVTAVELQASAASGAGWRTVEVWGRDVVVRVSRQRRVAGSIGTAPRTGPAMPRTRLVGILPAAIELAAPPFDLPDADPAADPSGVAVRPNGLEPAPRRSKRQRWRVAGTAGLLLLVWGAALYWMNGGNLAALWDGPVAAAPLGEALQWARESRPGAGRPGRCAVAPTVDRGGLR